MRSFAKAVKEELVFVERTDKQNKVELAALLQFLSTISITNQGLSIVVRTENAQISRFVMKLVKQYYPVQTETSILRKLKLNKNKVYLVRILNHGREILEDLGLWTKEGLQTHPSRALTNNKENAKAYLAGCFLAAGSVNDPNKTDYHLEISAGHEDLAKYILRVLNKLNLPGKMIKRRNQYVVYMKSVESINDFLIYVGAMDCAMEYADIRIQRDYLNSMTRIENCETANLVKSIRSGQQQIEAIEKLKANGKFDTLSSKVKEAAEIRLEHPEDSLAELAEHYEDKYRVAISKSGMKHRLEKIVELADMKKS